MVHSHDQERRKLDVLIMDAITNDHENFGMIEKEVKSRASEEGLAVRREDISNALSSLAGRGLVAAYILSPSSPLQLSTAVIDDPSCYFLLTSTGKTQLMSAE